MPGRRQGEFLCCVLCNIFYFLYSIAGTEYFNAICIDRCFFLGSSFCQEGMYAGERWERVV